MRTFKKYHWLTDNPDFSLNNESGTPQVVYGCFSAKSSCLCLEAGKADLLRHFKLYDQGTWVLTLHCSTQESKNGVKPELALWHSKNQTSVPRTNWTNKKQTLVHSKFKITSVALLRMMCDHFAKPKFIKLTHIVN